MNHWSKIKKLKRMSFAELRWRIASVAGRRRERSRWRRSSNSDKQNVIENIDNLIDRCVRLVPGSDSKQIELLSASQPASLLQKYQLRASQNAKAILRDHWMILGHPYDLTGSINWHQDIRTQYEWQPTFYADLPLYNLPGETDVKYPWELSRHQFLCELTRNYQLSGYIESAVRARELLLDWIEQNPVYEGVNWTSALEVAMRAISWIWVLAGLSSFNEWQAGDLQKIAASLRDHATYLSGNFSHYSSPYNHLIGEATGLLCISALLDDNKTTLNWREQARRVLTESGPTQFYQDHFGVEQAVGYHYYTLGFMVLAWQAGRAIGQPLDELTPVIHNAFKMGAAMRRPDGTWPAIGDLDSARAIPVHPANYWSFDSLQNVAAVLFDDPTLKIGQDDPGGELFWLTGSDGLTRWREMKAGDHKTVGHLFDDAGYAVACDGNDCLLFDAGPIAHGLFPDATPSTAHGHADTMQVLYHHDGKSVLNDCGMPFYGGDQDWVTYFRSPAAHNTVKIEDADLVRRAGRLAWSHEVQRPEINANFTDVAWLCNGKLEWPGVTHQRHVLCLPGNGVWIADLITTDKPRNATWYWQLPDSTVTLPSQMSATWDSMSLSCALSSSQPAKLIHDTANDSQPQGWRCLGYGEKRPGNRLSLRLPVEQTILVLTSIGRKDRPDIIVAIDDIQVTEQREPNGKWVIAGSLSGCSWLMSETDQVGQA